MTTPVEAIFHRPFRAPAHRLPREFTFPRGRTTARVASLQERMSAVAIDLFVYIAACPFFIAPLAVVLRDLWPLGAMAGAFAYLVLGWRSGQTFGMKATGTYMVDVRTGREPGLRASAARAALILPPAVAAFLLADAAFSMGSATFSSQPATIAGSCLVLGLAAIDYLCSLTGTCGQALHDRICHVAVIDDPNCTRPAPRSGLHHP